MEGVRCLVECWADFGDLLSAKVISHGPDVILSTGTEHIFVFNGPEKRVKTILQFDSPVTSLALSADECSLYALCENNLLYCTTLSPESSSLSAEQDGDPALSVVSKDSVLVHDVLTFTVAEDILITVDLQGSFWSFHLHELTHCSSRSTVFQKHTGFQVPAVTGVPLNDVDLQARANSVPTLTCIYPSSLPKACKHHPRLNPLLFCLLFGVDASLVNSPIVLCGLPDGRLVFFPLLLPALTSNRGKQKTPVRMCYSLEQPVSFIGTSVLGDQGPQCLVVIGQRGRILLIRANQRSSDGKAAHCRFIEHIVQGPVVCACVDGEHLYYSTATNLFWLSLSKILTSSSSSSITTRLEGDCTRPESAVCLNVCRVIALTEPSISPAGSVQLLAVSLSGRLLQVTLPQDSDKVNMPRLASSQAGQKIKDLLAGIGNVWERATVEKQQLELKNNTLKCLNHVLNICQLLLTCQKKDQEVCVHQPPIRCQGEAEWSTLLLKDSLVLICTLENQSSYALEQGWTLCLQVQSGLSVSAEGSSRTYSFALMKLDCGQKTEVTVPLESDGDLFLPVQIHCSLVYTLQSLLNPEEYRQLSTTDTSLSQLLTHTGCICLALSTLTLDWLDVLRIGEPSPNGDRIPKQISTWEATRMLLSSRQIHTDEPAMQKAAPYTVAVHISSELLRNWLRLHDCSSALLCVSVLRWLLCGTANTERQEVVQSPVVCATGPDRHAVRLLTKEVILSDFCSEGPLSVVEIQVESVSMSAVCGLHHAVLLRIQALLKDAAVKPEKPAELRRQHLCEAVRHMEHLYKELQDFRDPADGVMKTRTADSLFHLYLQLREKPLVIL